MKRFWGSSPGRAKQSLGNRRRLALEPLECRCVPSTVTNLTDHDPGSLRDALASTKAGGTVDFQAGLNGTIALTSGTLAITKDVTIAGPGPDNITISGTNTLQVFNIAAGHLVTISGLTIADGRSPVIAGGIYNDGTLMVSNCMITGNSSADDGGGIVNDGILTVSDSMLSGNKVLDIGTGGGILNTGTLTISNTILTNNFANSGSGLDNRGMATVSSCTITSNNGADDGGGIYNSGTLTVQSSTLSGNFAYDNGGGISSWDGTLTVSNSILSANNVGGLGFGSALNISGGSLMMSDSAVSGNSSFPGFGAIYIGSTTVTILNCTISANLTSDVGTVVCAGNVTISNCTISGNTAGNPQAAGGINNSGTLILSNSTISGNTCGSQDSAGGILNSGTLTVSNCTISDNTSRSPQGSLVGAAGGIANFANSTFTSQDATLPLLNSTVANNTASVNGPVGSQVLNAPFGTGSGKATVELRNTIIAGGGTKPNLLAEGGGTFISDGHNLTSDDGGGYLNGPSDVINVDPLLGPLQDNGGPTQTIALLPGSPAVDAGDNSNAPDFDQRGPGFPRIVGRVIDIGAYEAQPGPATHFQIQAPANVTSGTPFDVVVTALDAYGHTAVGYLGSVTFSSSDMDPAVVLPPSYTFTTSDQGSHTFVGGFTLVTGGSQLINATDTADGSIIGSATVTVAPGPLPPPGGGSARSGSNPRASMDQPVAVRVGSDPQVGLLDLLLALA
jgi:hypothetical protein